MGGVLKMDVYSLAACFAPGLSLEERLWRVPKRYDLEKRTEKVIVHAISHQSKAIA